MLYDFFCDMIVGVSLEALGFSTLATNVLGLTVNGMSQCLYMICVRSLAYYFCNRRSAMAQTLKWDACVSHPRFLAEVSLIHLIYTSFFNACIARVCLMHGYKYQ